jgi:hypothetical protein
LPGTAAVQCAAFFQQLWSGRPVNGTVYPTAAQKGRIRRIDNGVGAADRNIAQFNMYLHEIKLLLCKGNRLCAKKQKSRADTASAAENF